MLLTKFGIIPKVYLHRYSLNTELVEMGCSKSQIFKKVGNFIKRRERFLLTHQHSSYTVQEILLNFLVYVFDSCCKK